jgi:hypothetical protein
LGLGGLVAVAEGHSLVLLDEFGPFDVGTGLGDLPDEGELVADGVVDLRHGAAALKAQSVEAWHPGVVPAERRDAA